MLAKAKGDALIEGLLDPTITNGSENGKEQEEKYMLTLDELEEYIVLTADQIVTHSNSIFEKPDSIEQAKEFVNLYAISPPSTVGAVVLTHLPSKITVTGIDIAQINFNPSVASAPGGVDLIDRLLKDGQPVLSCAGGLMVEHPFVREHIDGIDGTEDGVMGLRKDLVLRLLKELKGKLDELA